MHRVGQNYSTNRRIYQYLMRMARNSQLPGTLLIFQRELRSGIEVECNLRLDPWLPRL